MVFKRLVPAVLVLSLLGCSNSDLAGRVIAGGAVAAQGLFISETDEVRIGQQTMAKVFTEMPEYPNPDVRAYVTAVGQKMVAQCERKSLPFEFHVVESNEVNAFAAPGGFIFVTTGALRLMKNEAQLAGVLGHEVGHVAKKHSVQSIQQAMAAQGVATAVLPSNPNQLVELGANLAATLILKGFGRGAELEADRVGAGYAFAGGYDPRELGGFLDALRKQSGDVPAWLALASDHPRTDDRLTQLSDYFTTQQYVFAGLVSNESAYKAAVLDKLGPAPAASAKPSPSPTATPNAQAMP